MRSLQVGIQIYTRFTSSAKNTCYIRIEVILLLVGVLLMRVTSIGQVTIPIALREKFGMLPDTEVEFGERGNKITIEKAKPEKGKLSRGQQIVARMVGKGTANTDLTTDQIMAWTRGWD